MKHKRTRTFRVLLAREKPPPVRRGSKLGRNYGECEQGVCIRIAPHKCVNELTDTIIHEMLHWYIPDAPEWWVRQVSRAMSREIFK